MYLNENLDLLIKKGRDEEALEVLEEYIHKNPNDYNKKIEYAIYLSDVPFHDDITALEVIDEIVKNNPTNIKALVVKGKMEDIHQIIKDGTLELLNRFLETHDEDAEYYGEILMLKAFYFITYKKYIEAEEILQESIKISPDFSWNYELLGNIYEDKEDFIQAKFFYEMALDNVVKIYQDNKYHCPYCVNEFIGEYIQAVYVSDINYNRLVKTISLL